MSSGNLMRLKTIKDYLKTKFISVPDEWILSKITGNNCGQEGVYRFWLNSDLRQIPIDIPVLPKDINVIKTDPNKQIPIKSTLYDKYALQINSILDISKARIITPADALEDEDNNENSEESDSENTNMFKRKKQKVKKEVKKKGPRMLMMSLTDGITEIKAIEYRTIESLVPDLEIGTKILVTGPVDVYGAVILLTTNNVTVLGGHLPRQTNNNNHNSGLFQQNRI